MKFTETRRRMGAFEIAFRSPSQKLLHEVLSLFPSAAPKATLKFRFDFEFHEQCPYPTRRPATQHMLSPQHAVGWLSEEVRMLDPYVRARWIVGNCFQTLMRAAGYFNLHSSFIEFEGHSLIFLGEGRSGKSTLSSLFATLDGKWFCDDLCYVKYNEGVFEFVPVPFLTKVRNKKNKLYLGYSTPKLADGDTQPVKKPILCFPKFRANHPIEVKTIGPRETLEELVAGNLLTAPAEHDAELIKENNLNTLVSLAAKSNSYRLRFCDLRLMKELPTIFQILPRNQPSQPELRA